MGFLQRINKILDFIFTDMVIKILFVITILLIPVLIIYGNPLYLFLLWVMLELLDYRNRKRKGKEHEEEWKW
jgi:hypothetical protein